MTPAELARAVRDLIAWSDVRDREARARVAAEHQAFAAGARAGDALARAELLGAAAAEKREISAAVAEALRRGDIIAENAAAAARRWHVCCRRCRLLGHQDGCPDCQDRAREQFGAPHPDDYAGAARRPLLMEARGAA